MTHAEATHRPPEVAHEAGFFSVFCDGPVPGLVSAKANRGRVCRPIANPTPILSRAGEMRIGSVLVLRRERNRCLTRLSRVTCSGTNGPFCRESLPYPNQTLPCGTTTRHLGILISLRAVECLPNLGQEVARCTEGSLAPSATGSRARSRPGNR